MLFDLCWILVKRSVYSQVERHFMLIIITIIKFIAIIVIVVKWGSSSKNVQIIELKLSCLNIDDQQLTKMVDSIELVFSFSFLILSCEIWNDETKRSVINTVWLSSLAKNKCITLVFCNWIFEQKQNSSTFVPRAKQIIRHFFCSSRRYLIYHNHKIIRVSAHVSYSQEGDQLNPQLFIYLQSDRIYSASRPIDQN